MGDRLVIEQVRFVPATAERPVPVYEVRATGQLAQWVNAGAGHDTQAEGHFEVFAGPPAEYTMTRLAS